MKFSYKKISRFSLFIVSIYSLNLTGCTKLVTVDAPYTSVNGANVYTNDATSISVMTGLYTLLASNGSPFSGINSISVFSGLSADELAVYGGMAHNASYYYYYTNSLVSSQKNGEAGTDYWTAAYPFIFTCNSAIEGLNASASVTKTVKQQLLGESYFMRAFFYFYLVNQYGDIPLALSTDYKVNEALARSSTTTVYQQIVSDLKTAETLLSPQYLDGNLNLYPAGAEQRVRPTKWAAMALLARTYLYTKDWTNAELESDSVINNATLFSLPELNSAFLANSTEAIWQLQPINNTHNTEDGWLFVLPPTGPDVGYFVYLNNKLVNSFEPGDQRRINWIDSVIVPQAAPAPPDTFYFAYKYKIATLDAPLTEYQMVLRLGEQYLVRAEAEAQQGNIAGSQSDLNMIRSRAMLPNTTANDNTSLIASILHERQVELFTELGQRWFDIKRTQSVDSVMTVATPLKANGNPWQSYQQLYPIAWPDIKADGNLVQNPGY